MEDLFHPLWQQTRMHTLLSVLKQNKTLQWLQMVDPVLVLFFVNAHAPVSHGKAERKQIPNYIVCEAVQQTKSVPLLLLNPDSTVLNLCWKN